MKKIKNLLLLLLISLTIFSTTGCESLTAVASPDEDGKR